MTGLALPTMRVITGAEVNRHVESGRLECLDVVRRAYRAHHDGDSVLPHSSFLRFPQRERDRIIALPGYLGGEFDIAGIKWIASWPGNVAHGLPRASAVLVLNDVTTGFPVAVLESSLISATRTAGAAVLAAELLAGARRTGRIAFVGTGLIAEHVRRFLRDLGWQATGYRLADLDHAAATGFAKRLTDDGATDVVVTDAETAMSQSDLIVLATVAGVPHLHDPALLAHRPIVLHLSLRDLAPEMILAAQNVTDDADHAVRERTSLHLAEQSTGHRDFIHGTIADLLSGRMSRDPERAVVFSPFGLGTLDLAVGKWVYDRVTADGHDRTVPDFFEGVSP
jgi:N-[(2S)-2-amino-2-carboxyethyl]-L-glutamate dehydrogenase